LLPVASVAPLHLLDYCKEINVGTSISEAYHCGPRA
jgi:hypothetical protein